jgi:hypothetical protein
MASVDGLGVGANLSAALLARHNSFIHQLLPRLPAPKAGALPGRATPRHRSADLPYFGATHFGDGARRSEPVTIKWVSTCPESGYRSRRRPISSTNWEEIGGLRRSPEASDIVDN